MKGTSAVGRRANSAVKCKEFKLEREEMKAEREKSHTGQKTIAGGGDDDNDSSSESRACVSTRIGTSSLKERISNTVSENISNKFVIVQNPCVYSDILRYWYVSKNMSIECPLGGENEDF